jgi:diaminopimelate epimerase
MNIMMLENLDFEKHHGLGNDYIIINNIKWKIPVEKMGILASKLCKEHFSVGADGLLFVCDSQSSDIWMRIFNNDGSEAEMCGNGIRCFSKFIYENNICKKERITIETLKGVIKAALKVEENKVVSVKIDMGSPIVDCDDIPVVLDGLQKQCVNEPIIALDRIYRFTAVSMGNPHAIIFTEELLNDEDLNKYGSTIHSNKFFPQKTNVEFVKIKSSQEAILRVFERGVGITNSCGTGSCAAVVAGTMLGIFKKNEPILMHNDGGDLEITYDGKNVLMEGPVVKVFTGFIDRIKV